MADKTDETGLTRRNFVHGATADGAAGALLGGFGLDPFAASAMAQEMGRSSKPLKAAFSNAGLQATWSGLAEVGLRGDSGVRHRHADGAGQSHD